MNRPVIKVAQEMKDYIERVSRELSVSKVYASELIALGLVDDYRNKKKTNKKNNLLFDNLFKD